MQDEVTAIKRVFVKLLPAFGSITDEELLQALCGSNAAQRALWVDREPDGKAAGNRNFGINAKGRQRANELSAVVQCDLRVAAAQAAVAKKAADAEAEAVHVRQILTANADAEAALAALGVAPKEAKPPHFTSSPGTSCWRSSTCGCPREARSAGPSSRSAPRRATSPMCRSSSLRARK